MENTNYTYDVKAAIARMDKRRKDLAELKVANGLLPVAGLTKIKSPRKPKTGVLQEKKRGR